MEISDQIKNILTIYLKNPDDYGDNGWKDVIVDLYNIALYDKNPFSENTVEGLSYMCEVVYHTVCYQCGDAKVHDWFKKFAKAFVDNSEIPEFNCRGCLNGKCMR